MFMTPAWADMIFDGDVFEEDGEMLVEAVNDANDFSFRFDLINPGNDSVNILNIMNLTIEEAATAMNNMNNNPGILNVNLNFGIQNGLSNGFSIKFSVPAK